MTLNNIQLLLDYCENTDHIGKNARKHLIAIAHFFDKTKIFPVVTKNRGSSPNSSIVCVRTYVGKEMTGTENEISFESSKTIVAQRSPDGNIVEATCATSVQHGALLATYMQHIREAAYLEYDFSPFGVISVVLPDGTRFSFQIEEMTYDMAELLVMACLHDKTVIGNDLYTSYTFSYCLSEEWQPNCSLNIPTIEQAFRLSNPFKKGLEALPQLMSMTGTKSFDAAMGRLFEWDEACDGSFFRVRELMPHAMARICSETFDNRVFQGSNHIMFEADRKTAFLKRRASFPLPAKLNMLKFDLCDLPAAQHEFKLCIDYVANARTRAWKMV